jgi:hypothetical protein
MKKRCGGYLCILCALLFALSAFAQDGKFVVANAVPKELKRTAHRLRIPVEQLKNARKALQEATDLVKTIDPYPVDQLYNIGQNWTQLNRPKAKAVIDAFIQDLRSRAADASDMQSYQRATTAGMMLLQSMDDYEKIQQTMQSWPEPKAAWGEIAGNFRKSLEASVQSQSLYRLVNEDPEKALEVLSQSGDSSNYRYSLYGQVAQGLMNTGKKEEALRLMDQTISTFGQHADDPRALQEYENFIRVAAVNMDSARAGNAVNQWITQIMKQPASLNCGGTLKSGDSSVDLNCSEYRALNFLRGMSMKPGIVMKTLDAAPELKSKLDSIGGIDNLYGSSNLTYNPPAGMQQSTGSAVMSGGITTTPENPSKLFQQLKGKADSNSVLVKRKLQEAVKGPESISLLISIASMASYQDPELADLALEVAQPLLSRVEPLSKRASALQSLVQAYRQVEGSVDTDVLKNGFVLADQLREEASVKKESVMNATMQFRPSAGDQLEAFLVGELSRDSFEDAMRYARSMEEDTSKLQCMMQIVQALRSSY